MRLRIPFEIHTTSEKGARPVSQRAHRLLTALK
jgi:hypothetical protein